MNSPLKNEVAKNESVWISAPMPIYNTLNQNLQTDVCIIGAGISGMTTAYMLLKAGKSVVILDDGPVAGGMTQVTTAHLANAIDDRYFEIERLHGEEGSRLAAHSHTEAINRIEDISRSEKINCDFHRLDGFLFLGKDDKEEILERELAAAHRAGLTNVEKLQRAPVQSFDTGVCLRFPNQAQFHPLKYMAGVARAVERQGGKIFTKTHADRITGGMPATVTSGDFTVTAGAVVVATNAPINDLVTIHTKQAPYMTYVIGARIPRGSVTRALYWDTQDPYHYIRLQPMPSQPMKESASQEYDLLIVGGEDHKTGQAQDTQERYGHLETWARALFPMMEQIEFTWSGQVMESIDGLAFIGKNPLDADNVYIVTGDSGMGMTHGTIAGVLITDLIIGRKNPWETLYDPGRKTLSALGEFTKEAINVAVQYTDWLTGGNVSSTGEISKESGAILRRGLSKVAVYRDDLGKRHEFSAVCTHLGCIVGWNPNEKTWDCPCHGSRYDKLGKVINGPANKDMSPSDNNK